MARAAAATLGLLALHTSLPPAAAGGTGLADAYYVVGAATTSVRSWESLRGGAELGE